MDLNHESRGQETRISDGLFGHDHKRDRKIMRIVIWRADILKKRGMPEDKAIEQATAELVQFRELLNLDSDSINDLLFAEDNFPHFTATLDARSKRSLIPSASE
jgi:hypothetical protein